MGGRGPGGVVSSGNGVIKCIKIRNRVTIKITIRIWIRVRVRVRAW